MTQGIETINGHQYLVTRDNNNNIVATEGRDPIAAVPTPPIRAKAAVLIAALTSGSATQAQRDRAQALTLALLLNLTDA